MIKKYSAERIIPIPSLCVEENDYKVVNIVELEYGQWERYWTSIIRAGLLKYRLPDTHDPVMKDVVEMVNIPSNVCYYILDAKTNEIVADMMLNNIHGLSAYIHFSIHPRRHGAEAIKISQFSLGEAFKICHQASGQPLRTLIGVTPVSNRLAIRLLGKLKFKKLDILPDIFYNRYNQKYTDGYISKLSKEDCTWVVKGTQAEVAKE